MQHQKVLVASAAIVTMLAMSPMLAGAAAPDGQGPWADSVVSVTQGLQKDGTPVAPERSNPLAMLGVAENDTDPTHFYSLGFGGTATLGFENGISSGVVVVEATNVGYPNETAKVEVSTNGTDFVLAGNVSQDGQVSIPNDIGCVKWVRVTDTSVPANFAESNADAYDVDGVEAKGVVCYTDKKMTGGGSLWTADSTRVTHGMELACDGTKGHLQVNWGKGNKFHMESLVSALCTDDPAIDSGNPDSEFDTYKGHGIGKYNGTSGYHAYWVFTDAGEPGKSDQGWLQIWNPTHTTKVLEVPLSYLKNGNHQAH